MIKSCESHIEELIDFFLDEVEELPVMEKLTDLGAVCNICHEKATYQLTGGDVLVKWE